MEKPKYQYRPVARLLRLLQPEKKEIFYIYFYAFINGIINLSLPLGIQSVIGLLTGAQISASFGVLVGLITAGMILVSLLQIMQQTLTERLQQRIFVRAAFEYAYRLPRIPMSILKNYEPSSLANRFFDVLNIQKALPKLLVDFSAAVMQLIFGLLILSIYHTFFVFFGIIMIGILIVILSITWNRGINTSLTESKYKYKIADWLEEILEHSNVFKRNIASDWILNYVDKLVGNYLEARKAHFRVLIVQYINLTVFKGLITAGLLILGGYFVVQEEMNLGQFVASEIIILIVIASAEKIVMSIETLFDALTAVEKMGYITDMAMEENKTKAINIEKTSVGMSVEMQGVSIELEEKISNISFAVAAGNVTWIKVNRSADKKPLLYTIASIFTETKGNVLFNDLPRENYNIEALRGNIGVITPEEGIIYGSLRENLVLGRKQISDEQMKNLCQEVDLLSWIQTKKEGFENAMPYHGIGISDEILTKILIVRAFLGAPKLIVVDDMILGKNNELLPLILDLHKKYACTLIILSDNSNPSLSNIYL